MISADEKKPRRKGGNGLILLVLAAIVIFALMKVLVSQGGPAVDAVGWQKDFEAAQLMGKDESKPLLVYFTASWCPPCQRMKKEVFSQAEAGTVIRSKAVPVIMDVTDPDEKTAAIAQKHGVGSIPTMILMSADGTVIAEHVGYMSLEELRGWLSKERTTRVSHGSR